MDPIFDFPLFLGHIFSLWLIPITDYVFSMKSIWKNVEDNRLRKKTQRLLSEIKLY